jgi:hypothetical protein
MGWLSRTAAAALAVGAACSGSDSGPPATPAGFAYAGAYTAQSRSGGESGVWYASADVEITAAREVFRAGSRC